MGGSQPTDDDHTVARHEASKHLQHQTDVYLGGWYWPARRLLRWGEVQHAKHAEWQDLFHDLIMVAAAFQLGAYLKANLTAREGALGLIAMGLTSLGSWSMLLGYRARYVALSPAHRLLDALEGLLVASAQHNIVQDLREFERLHMYAFLACTIAQRLLALGRRLELALAHPHERYASVRTTNVKEIFRIGAEVAVLAGGFGARSAVPLFAVLIGAWALPLLLLYLPVGMGWLERSSMVPLHVEFTMTRLGELVMLMLGEGVLSLVVSRSTVALGERGSGGGGGNGDGGGYGGGAHDGDGAHRRTLAEAAGADDEARRAGGGAGACGAACIDDLIKSSISFASSFLMLTALMYLYYRANPTGHGTRHHHAMRRDATRGIAWNTSHAFLSVGLIALGVALKAIHPYAAQPVPSAYVMLLAISGAVTLPTICVQQLLHPGIGAFVRAPSRAVRCALWLGKMGLSYAMLLMLLLPASTEGCVYLAWACALAGASAACVLVEKAPHVEAAMWAHIDAVEATRSAAAIGPAPAPAAVGAKASETDGDGDGGAVASLATTHATVRAPRPLKERALDLSQHASSSSASESSDSHGSKPCVQSAACVG